MIKARVCTIAEAFISNSYIFIIAIRITPYYKDFLVDTCSHFCKTMCHHESNISFWYAGYVFNNARLLYVNKTDKLSWTIQDWDPVIMVNLSYAVVCAFSKSGSCIQVVVSFLFCTFIRPLIVSFESFYICYLKSCYCWHFNIAFPDCLSPYDDLKLMYWLLGLLFRGRS